LLRADSSSSVLECIVSATSTASMSRSCMTCV
jgi:hypothetical protein